MVENEIPGVRKFMSKTAKLLWVSWEHHRRTDTICKKLNIPMQVINTRHTGILRYIILCVKTLHLLFKNRPSTLIVQNPSIILSFLGLLLRFLFRYKLIVDAHNEGVSPFINTGFIFKHITRLLHRKANLTIVTNKALEYIVIENKGRPFILPDGLPDFSSTTETLSTSPQKFLLLIATYAADEPVKEIFEAIGLLDTHKISLKVTGNDKKLPENIRRTLSPDIKLLGFIPEDQYVQEIRNSTAIIDLTTMPNCLVCGAYEAISLGKPIILSRSEASISLFHKGAIFTDHDPYSIKEAIIKLLNSIDTYTTGAQEMKKLYEKQWDTITIKFAEELT